MQQQKGGLPMKIIRTLIAASILAIAAAGPALATGYHQPKPTPSVVPTPTVEPTPVPTVEPTPVPTVEPTPEPERTKPPRPSIPPFTEQPHDVIQGPIETLPPTDTAAQTERGNPIWLALAGVFAALTSVTLLTRPARRRR
jgi:hypothetical protein